MILHAEPIIAAGLAAVLRECCGFQIAPTQEHPNPDRDLPPTDVVIVDYETAPRVAESAPQWTKHLHSPFARSGLRPTAPWPPRRPRYSSS